MSTTISLCSVLADARSLVTRLQDRDKLADALISNAHSLNERINCMREYQDEITKINEQDHHRPRSHLVLSLQKENKQIKDLQNENRQLRMLLQDHQSALELVMMKYREQVGSLVRLSTIEQMLAKQLEADEKNSTVGIANEERQHDFAAAFSECLKMGEKQSKTDQEEMARLRYENATLRQLLRVADHHTEPGLAKQFANALQESNDTISLQESNSKTLQADTATIKKMSKENSQTSTNRQIEKASTSSNADVSKISSKTPHAAASDEISPKRTEKSGNSPSANLQTQKSNQKSVENQKTAAKVNGAMSKSASVPNGPGPQNVGTENKKPVAPARRSSTEKLPFSIGLSKNKQNAANGTGGKK